MSRTRQRNKAKKAAHKSKREKRAVIEADRIAKTEIHLGTRIMRDLERMYGRGYTRAAGSMEAVLWKAETY